MNDNIPPSQMLRVPTPLVDAVKELSRLHRAGCTSIILTGLQQLIASIDSNVDIDISSTGNKLDTALIAELISSQIEPLQAQLEQSVKKLVAEEVGDHLESTEERVTDFSYFQFEDVSTRLELLKEELKNFEQRLQLVESTTESTLISTEATEATAVVHESKGISLASVTSDNLSTEVEAEKPAVVEAIAAKETQHPTRKQLGQMLGGVSHETIRQWEESGKLTKDGWELVPDTGTSPKNPRLYRPIAPKSVDVSNFTQREIAEHRRKLEIDGRLRLAKQDG